MTADAVVWPRPRALLLDAMGTLIGLRDSVGTTYARAAASHGLTVEPEMIDRSFPGVLRDAPPLAFPDLEESALPGAELGWWASRIDEVLIAAGGEPGPAELHRHLFDLYADPHLWRVYDDVAACLPRWRQQGLKLAVVSNFDRRLEGLLEGLGLATLIDVVIVSSRCGAAKPTATPFLQALAALEVEAGEAWHVGDSREDVEGARAAGLPCLLVRRP